MTSSLPPSLPSHPRLSADPAAVHNVELFRSGDPGLWQRLAPILDTLEAGPQPPSTRAFVTHPRRYYVTVGVPGRDEVCVVAWVQPAEGTPFIVACKNLPAGT